MRFESPQHRILTAGVPAPFKFFQPAVFLCNPLVKLQGESAYRGTISKLTVIVDVSTAEAIHDNTTYMTRGLHQSDRLPFAGELDGGHNASRCSSVDDNIIRSVQAAIATTRHYTKRCNEDNCTK